MRLGLIVRCWLLLVLGTCGVSAQWIQWPVSEGGNGHWYRLTTVEGTWQQAESEAVIYGGHLVAINSAEENAWLLGNVVLAQNRWIGLRQLPGSPEPRGGWEWSNGDALTYTNWCRGEPNNDKGTEAFAEIKGRSSACPAGQWNDQGPTTFFRGIIEVPNRSSSYLPTPGNAEGILPIHRLGRWNNASKQWIPVAPSEISSGNVHVLVHGWAPFEVNCVLSQEQSQHLALAWNCDAYFEKLNGVAAAITDWYSTHKNSQGFAVLAYSWIDESATISPFSSQSRADGHGVILADALMDLGVADGSVKLHLLGHSHGARLVTQAAIKLENSGINVQHLTYWDSPETICDISSSSSFNSIDRILTDDNLRGNFTIGVGTEETFIDNYYSVLGMAYAVALTVTGYGLVNVNLRDEPPFPDNQCDLSDIRSAHSYPIEWYAEATLHGSTFGLAWSPVVSASGTLDLSSDYDRDSADEWVLVPAGNSVTQPLAVGLGRPLALTRLTSSGAVETIAGGFRLAEGSSAFWTGSFEKSDADLFIDLEYTFTNPGDGDEFGIWIDEHPRLLISGENAGANKRTASTDIRMLPDGEHLLTIALHSTGGTNAIIVVTNLISRSQVQFERADVNADGEVDIADVVAILLYLFRDEYIVDCVDALDVNDDSGIDISDVTYTLSFLFLGRAAVPDPFGSCGVDPTSDSLGCDLFNRCR